MNDSTHTTTTTPADDVIANVIAQLRFQLGSVDAQLAILSSQRTRVYRALMLLTDEADSTPVAPPFDTPATVASKAQQAAQAVGALQAALQHAEAEASVRLDGDTHTTNGRPQLPLQHTIHELLIADGPMKPTDIANALLSLGYQTKAKHFVQVVYMALKKFRGDLFERNSSGYWLPASAPAPRRKSSKRARKGSR